MVLLVIVVLSWLKCGCILHLPCYITVHDYLTLVLWPEAVWSVDFEVNSNCSKTTTGTTIKNRYIGHYVRPILWHFMIKRDINIIDSIYINILVGSFLNIIGWRCAFCIELRWFKPTNMLVKSIASHIMPIYGCRTYHIIGIGTCR